MSNRKSNKKQGHIELPHGCHCTPIAVYPEDWETKNASVERDWYFNFRFYDSQGRCKQVSVRRMNHKKTREARQIVTRHLIDKMLIRLVEQGYNPILGVYHPPVESEEITPYTPFIKAIDKAQGKIKGSSSLKDSIKSMINIVSAAARELKYDGIPVGQIQVKHIYQTLERCQTNRDLSPVSYNHYRAYLMMLFKKLLPLGAVNADPVSPIEKQVAVKKLRRILTAEEKKIVHETLQPAKHHNFRRYLNIFYHSGSRTSELFRMQVKDVHLDTQYFKVTIIKGKQRREVLKPIKNIAVKYWKEAIENGNRDDYIFSRGLKPGVKPLRPDRIPKIWDKLFSKTNKDGKKIRVVQATFYAIKHEHAQEVERMLGKKAAQSHMDHTTEATTQIYLGEVKPEYKELKEMQNEF